MALADTANLVVKLTLGGNFLSQIGKATSGLSKFDAKLGQTESRAFRAGQQIGTGIKNTARIAAVGVGFLVSQIGLGLQSLIELEKQQAQTNAVIASTKGIAGVTGDEVTRLAEKFESLNATVGDEFIRAGENMLLTFTNIRGKAFEPTLQAVLDLNTGMGNGPEGLTKTAIQLGKALNDPTSGLGALRKSGVAFSAEQLKRIKQLQKENKLFEAQQIILAEVNKEFGGRFAAEGGTTAGKIAGFTDAIEDLQRTLAKALLPVLGNVADALKKTLADPAVVAGVEAFGKSLAGLISPQNLAEAARVLQDVFGAAAAAAPTIAAAAGAVAGFVGKAVSVFRSLPPEIQKLAVGAFVINKLTGGLVTNLAGGLISGVLKQLVSGVVNVRGASVIVTGPGVPGAGAGAGAGAAGVAAKGGLGVLSKVFLVGEAIGLALLVSEVRNGIVDGINKQAEAIETQTQKFLRQNPSKADLENSLRGVTQGIIDIRSNPLAVLVQGDALNTLEAMRVDIARQLANQGKAVVGPEKFGPPVPSAGRTGGASLEERTDAGNAIRAGILQRAVAAGFHPSSVAIERTLDRNNQHLIDIRNAVLGLKPGDIQGRIGPRAKDDKVVVKVSSSIRDTIKAGDIRGRFGKTPTQAGSD